MANENFGLGFTVEAPANWTDNGALGKVGEAGQIIADFFTTDDKSKAGEAGTIFADIPALVSAGEAGTIFADILMLDGVGEAATADTTGLCAAPSLLSGPGQSVLSSEGGFPSNDLSCP